MNEFQIKPATRQGVKPLIVAYSESGCGKTYSALLLARGIAGPSGKIVMADSESGRGSLYADIPEIGGYDVFEIAPPFSPARYVAAIDAIEAAGAAVGIIDSGSHEWEGIGGVLDMAGQIEERSGKTGLHCWREPKFEHGKFVQRLMRTRMPLIVCLRAKYKSRQTKDEKGKTVIVKDDTTSPIQAEDFIFEATAHFEILPNHTIIVTKCSHPSLRACFPEDKKSPLTVEHGRAIARWCAAAGGTAPTESKPESSPTASGSGDVKALKKELWTLTAAKHHNDPKALYQWLIDECILGDSETLEELGPARLQQIITKTRDKLGKLL